MDKVFEDRIPNKPLLLLHFLSDGKFTPMAGELLRDQLCGDLNPCSPILGLSFRQLSEAVPTTFLLDK